MLLCSSLTYEQYLDKVMGGWFGKCLGGAIGAPWECYKGWVEVSAERAVPQEMPPNDDLDLQVLWLGVVEEKGPWFRATDLADAWMSGCWYPFNEYGVFRKNYALGIPPPYTSQVDNDWWETGMGCPIRSEIWGYLAPGTPELAARFASMDGWLDHTSQSAGAEMMFSAMAADAFLTDGIRELIDRHIGYLPAGSTVRRLTECAIRGFDSGLSLAESRERVLLAGGNPEACDAQVNVPFTILGLLYGMGDLWETIRCCLRLGFDTDCTCATAGAFVGQIVGYAGLPERWKSSITDELVMGIEYRRPEPTITALARDTARAGVLMSRSRGLAVEIVGAPEMTPWPDSARPATPASLSVEYPDGLTVAPGEVVRVRLAVSAEALTLGARAIRITCPEGWSTSPTEAFISPDQPEAMIAIAAPAVGEAARWPRSFRFVASIEGGDDSSLTFALLGASLWTLLGVSYEPFKRDVECNLTTDDAAILKRPLCALCGWRADGCQGQCMAHMWASIDGDYIADEANPDVIGLSRHMARVLGTSPVLCARTSIVPLDDLVKLHGEQCIYLHREFASPCRRDAVLMVGNTEAFRLYLNGALVAQPDVHQLWAPNNTPVPVTLEEGVNTLVVKLLKRTDNMRFSLMFRGEKGHASDHITDLEDIVPEIWKECNRQ